MIASIRATLFVIALLLYLLALASAIPRPRIPLQSRSTSVTPLSSKPFRLPSVASARLASNRSSLGCLRRFASHPDEYHACLTRPCFIFLQEEPYIELDPSMTQDIHTSVFPCNSPRSKFKLLGGTAFDIMAKTAARDAMCVWGGPDCRFNNAVNFISEQAIHAREYMFAFTGLLLESSDRRRDTILPSISIRQEDLAVFGPRIPTGNPFPLWRLIRPFHWSAWGIWIALIVSFSALFWIAILIFAPKPLNYRTFVDFIIDDCPASSPLETSRPADSVDTMPGDPDPVPNMSLLDRALTYNVARRLLRTAIRTTSLIFFLFYEIAVVHFLFIQMSAPNVRDLSSLSHDELKEYSVEKNAATEDMFIRKVYGSKRRPVPEILPWKRCDYDQLCFDWALDKKEKVKYVVTFRSSGTFNLLTRDACTNMTLYGTKKISYSYGAGWVFGSTVNETFRDLVNRDILDMLLTGDLLDIIEKDVGTLDTPKCSPKIKSIDERIIGISVLILVVPFLILLLVLVFMHAFNVHRTFSRSYAPRAYANISAPSKAYSPECCEKEKLKSRERDRLSALKAILTLSLRKKLTIEEEKLLKNSMATIQRIFFKEKD